MQTLALLGDSIFDNRPYVAPEPDTMAHLQRLLGGSWSVELLARDGSTIADVRFQLSQLPAATTCAVLSVGGNDAAGHIGLLAQPASSVAEVLAELGAIAESFARRYQQLVGELAGQVPRLALCTIYEPPLLDPITARLARVPLSLLNDRIVRIASRLSLEVADLRAVCTEPSDFVQQIEPSPSGAAKIAAAISAVVLGRPPVASARVFAA